MTTVTHGEIIDIMLELKTRVIKELFFACFCSSSTSGIPIFNHYTRLFDHYFETLRALADKH